MKDLIDFKLIVMDFDGVIAKNSAHRISIVKEVGIITVIKRYMGLKRANKIINPGIYKMQREKFNEMELETNIIEIIQNLKDKKIAILSLNSNKIIKRFLEKFKLEKEFDRIIGIEDMKYPKPFPNSLTSLRKYFNEKREDTIFIGDSWTDKLCGKLARIKFLDVKEIF